MVIEALKWTMFASGAIVAAWIAFEIWNEGR